MYGMVGLAMTYGEKDNTIYHIPWWDDCEMERRATTYGEKDNAENEDEPKSKEQERFWLDKSF